eukprot:7379878-Prymnesium_polylepis.1
MGDEHRRTVLRLGVQVYLPAEDTPKIHSPQSGFLVSGEETVSCILVVERFLGVRRRDGFVYLFVIPPAAGRAVGRQGGARVALGQKLVVYQGQALLLPLGGGPDGFKDVCFQNDRARKEPYYAKFTPYGQRGQRRLPKSNAKSRGGGVQAGDLHAGQEGAARGRVVKKEREEKRQRPKLAEEIENKEAPQTVSVGGRTQERAAAVPLEPRPEETPEPIVPIVPVNPLVDAMGLGGA